MSTLTVSEILERKFAEIEKIIGPPADRAGNIPAEGIEMGQLKAWMASCRPRLRSRDIAAWLGINPLTPQGWARRGKISKATALAITECARNAGLPLLPWERGKKRPEDAWKKMLEHVVTEQAMREIS